MWPHLPLEQLGGVLPVGDRIEVDVLDLNSPRSYRSRIAG
jgi:hypothetical protein